MSLLQLIWLTSALKVLLTAVTPTAAAANKNTAVCAGVAGLWAAAGWATVLAGLPASAKADEDVLPQSLRLIKPGL